MSCAPISAPRDEHCRRPGKYVRPRMRGAVVLARCDATTSVTPPRS
jgi:hypothetical protein